MHVGWFSKKSQSDKSGPDDALSMFSVTEADQFRVVVRTVLAEMGREVEVFADHVRADDGSQYGLWNVAAHCRAEGDGPRSWPALVRGHYEKLFAAESAGTPLDQGHEAATAALYARLAEEQLLRSGPPESYEYGTQFADGVLQVLAVDTPTTVQTPTRDALEAVAPLAELLDVGWRNSRRLLDTEEFEVETVEHDGHSFTVVMGESFFTASMALFLPEAVARWQPDADLSEGIVFAIPHRHQLAFGPAWPQSSALGALILLPRFAALGFSDGPGPLSPHIFYWRDGQVTRLTQLGADGSIELTPGPHLERILSADSN